MDQTTQANACNGTIFSQYAALCWRMNRGQVEVLLVTSRDTGRWIIPKGWPMKDLAPHMAAAQEAWEEAGVEGNVEAHVLGDYSYTKTMRKKSDRSCVVSVFPLRVNRLADKFPEKKERRRKWFSARTAARKVDEAELRDLLRRLDEEPALLDGAQGT